MSIESDLKALKTKLARTRLGWQSNMDSTTREDVARVEEEIKRFEAQIVKLESGQDGLTLNLLKLAEFTEAYTAGLTEAVSMFPEQYDYTVAQVPQVVTKMVKAIRENPRGVQYTNSIGFKKACGKLGIPYTVKAVMAYLEVRK